MHDLLLHFSAAILLNSLIAVEIPYVISDGWLNDLMDGLYVY